MTAPNTFSLAGGGISYEAVEVAQAAKLGDKKFFLVENDTPFAPLDLESVTAAAKKVGGTVAGTIDNLPTSGITDYAPYAQQIVSSGANVVSFPLAIQQALPLMQAVRQLGSTAQFIINDGAFTPKLLAANASVTNGLIITTDTPPATAATEKVWPVMKTFLADMKAELASGDAGANQALARPFQLKIWLTTEATFALMKNIKGTINAASTLAALESAKNLSLGGIFPPWTPSATLTIPGIGVTHYSEAYYWEVKVENGQQILESKTPVNATKYF